VDRQRSRGAPRVGDSLSDPGFRIVETDEGLSEVIDALSEHEAYALDTEFHRERTYWPRPALVQLAWPGSVVLVDPLAVDLAPFRVVLEGPQVAVLHAADQDLEILELVCGAIPQRLFDTQIAAAFLGLSSPSLATLLDRFAGVKVAKGDRLTDWLQRPLTDGQLEYAANDVAHLLAARDRIIERLTARGRLEWALDECELHRIRPRGARDPEEAWRRIKEVRALRGRARAVAQAVAAWRERRAAALDLPVRFVLSDIALVGIAQRAPTDRAGLDAVRGFDRNLKGEPVAELLAAVAEGLRREPPTDQAESAGGVDRDLRPAVALVSAWIAQLSRDLDLDTAVLATRGDVEALLRGDPEARLGRGWRAELAGTAVRRLVVGDAAVAFAGDGELVIEERSHRPLDP